MVAVIGVKGVIQAAHVQPIFIGTNKPQLIINVPSETLWSGSAIDIIHAHGAAFGKVGDISRAADTLDAGAFRNKNMDFFINAMKQHGNVTSVSYVFDSVFKLTRRVGTDLIVGVIDAYNMSAEDIRNAKTRLGHFDALVKSTSYGSVTEQAETAAEFMGAKALTFKGLMQWLAK
jgi:hypothetical protein